METCKPTIAIKSGVQDALKTNFQAKPRLYGLDYLRGLAAFGIMLYHYSSWTYGELEAGSTLGRIGVYGVAIFYILSGLTLSHVYSATIDFQWNTLKAFYRKRALRIFPLLWVATLASILISKSTPNIADIILNITGLFGLFKWNVYFATGAWSIGNELVFYLLFPIFIHLTNYTRFGLEVTLFIIITIFSYFTFFAFDSTQSLASQWYDYTNPLNQVLFFFGGALLTRIPLTQFLSPTLITLICCLALVLFRFFPIDSTSINLVTGANRLVLSSCCFIICYCFYRSKRAQPFFDRPLAMLGQSSYSLYLLHPLIYAIIKAFILIAIKQRLLSSTFSILPLSVIISLIVSYLSYNLFEKKFIQSN